ncbi:glycoside hydrolase family 2 TIM barrel-domain containing protein [Kiritimatiellaeota bacterium B1221]|nr:glycoside hydrolase family 2 TIM barrel-domain containing protein [Kiritimatiellaeota bacterium B1221]
MLRPLICLIIIFIPPLFATEFPLKDLAVDQSLLLTQWQFQAEPATGEVDWSTDEFSEFRSHWPKTTVPGIWDKAPGEIIPPIPEQAGWFRTTLPLPRLKTSQVNSICFLGVKYTADVFVNGEYLGVHRGGYTPFMMDLPTFPPETGEIEILVRVDNRLTPRTIPKHKTGWEVYGGIDREVYLLQRPKIRPEQIFVQPKLNPDGQWELHINAKTRGQPQNPLSIRLMDGRDIVKNSEIENWQSGIDHIWRLQAPKLWSPDNPHLYQLELSWGEHQLRFPVGLREVKWQAGKLHLNGQPLWLQGFGQHEYFPDAASILTSEQRREDLVTMKKLYGANTLRTGHYPHHPDLFNLADELGLLLFTEIPVWQNQSKSLLMPEVWDNWIAPQLDEIILTHRNHPSIFGWGVLNEIGGAHPYIIKAREHILKRDPSRGVAAVIASHHDFGINRITDFAARNLHYGWYHSRSVYKLREGLNENLTHANGNAIWVAELGGMARPGRLGGGFSDDVRGTETYQDKMTRFGLQYIMSRADELAGISLWTWSDYFRDGHPHYHGILSKDRQPKLAAYTANNLMAQPLLALGTEENAVIPTDGTFRAGLFVFSRHPQPGTRVQLNWQIRSPATVHKQGLLDLTLGKDLSVPAGEISWTSTTIPDNPLRFLYLELQDAHGNFLHSQAIPFEVGDGIPPGVLRVPPPANGQKTFANFYGMTFSVYPHTGFMLPLAPGKYQITLDGKEYDFTIKPGAYMDLF